MHLLKSPTKPLLLLILILAIPVVMASDEDLVFSLAAEGNSEELLEALQDFPDINRADSTGMTLLLNAVLYGNLKNAAILLDANADPELANGLGLNPLFLSIRNGDTELVQILLQKGADPEYEN